MAKILVVGSGPSAVHFSKRALQNGHAVEIVDVGLDSKQQGKTTLNFNELKSKLDDPVKFFLGDSFEGVKVGDVSDNLTRIPQSRKHVISKIPQFEIGGSGFDPLYSFAKGGLAEVWTAGCYPFSERDLEAFPITLSELKPYYELVAREIGVSGSTTDDFAKILPEHGAVQNPLDLDPLSANLLQRYREQQQLIQNRYHCNLGRSRVAVLSESLQDRSPCLGLGRCDWGCPVSALYTPKITLADCAQFDEFKYSSNYYVQHLKINSDNKICGLIAQTLDGESVQEFNADIYVLAAGTLSTSRIFLDSIRVKTGKAPSLFGLMDNPQVLLPFIAPKCISQPPTFDRFQYNLLAMSMVLENKAADCLGLITTLKAVQIHQVIQSMPLGLKMSLRLFRQLHSGLGVVNLNFSDRRRETNTIRLSDDSSRPELIINYSVDDYAPKQIKALVKQTKQVLRRLGCFTGPGNGQLRPAGSSSRYAGTLPMQTRSSPLTVSPQGRSHDFSNLYIVDGSVIPALPAKNITFTLMANAARIADFIDK